MPSGGSIVGSEMTVVTFRNGFISIRKQSSVSTILQHVSGRLSHGTSILTAELSVTCSVNVIMVRSSNHRYRRRHQSTYWPLPLVPTWLAVLGSLPCNHRIILRNAHRHIIRIYRGSLDDQQTPIIAIFYIKARGLHRQ